MMNGKIPIKMEIPREYLVSLMAHEKIRNVYFIYTFFTSPRNIIEKTPFTGIYMMRNWTPMNRAREQ